MEVTVATWIIGLAGMLLMGLLWVLQLVAVIKPRGRWTIKNIYGGSPDNTDAKAYFAFNQGHAWADTFFWGPIQIAGSIGMLLGQRWGFLLGLGSADEALSIEVRWQVSTLANIAADQFIEVVEESPATD